MTREGGEPAPAPLQPLTRHDLRLDVVEVPPRMPLGRMARATVHVRPLNGPTRTQHGLRVAYHWETTAGRTVVWDGLRTPLPKRIAVPLELSVRIAPPPVPGAYRLGIAWVEEGVAWSEPRTFPVTVVAAGTGENAFSSHAVLNDGAGCRLRHRGLPRPNGLVCETINVCPNRCVFCAYDHQLRTRGRMSMTLFEELMYQYEAIGGGELSFTSLGEPFLDRLLPERLELLDRFPSVGPVSLTTSARPVTQLADDRLARILDRVDRIQVSIYGTTAGEHRALTGREGFDQMRDGLRRLIESFRGRLVVALRSGEPFPQISELLRGWLAGLTVRAQVEVADPLRRYGNWGRFEPTDPLPAGARWRPDSPHKTQCLYPLAALKVYWNGNVSLCPCADYDNDASLALGNVRSTSLREICSSPRYARLWNWQRNGIPEFCRRCTHYVPLESAIDIQGALNSMKPLFA